MTRRIRSLVTSFAAFAMLAAVSFTSALAAGSPSITATGSQNGQIHVTGTGFTLHDSVLVVVYDSGYHIVASTVTTASQTYGCGPLGCYPLGPGINVTMSVASCSPSGTLNHVIAYDGALVSNWSNATVQCPW